MNESQRYSLKRYTYFYPTRMAFGGLTCTESGPIGLPEGTIVLKAGMGGLQNDDIIWQTETTPPLYGFVKASRLHKEPTA